MLKIINGLIEADAGKFSLGSKVQIGYYDQEHHVLHMDKTIFQEISDTYPTLTETEIRNMLAAFLFTGDDVFKEISALSGGERGRVSLAKLMLSEANFLILDEPTNHLDIASKEILEEALVSYTGTVLYVSHDRYFINQTATRIMELTNQAVVNYIGDYDYYLEKKEELTSTYAPGSTSPEAPTEEKSISENKLSWQQMKEEQAKKRKREAELKKVEARIEELETRDSEIDETMVLPDVCTNVAECTKLSREKAAIAEELEELYEKLGRAGLTVSSFLSPYDFYGSSIPRCCSKHTPSLRSVPSSTASRIDAEIKSTASSAQVFMEYLFTSPALSTDAKRSPVPE